MSINQSINDNPNDYEFWNNYCQPAINNLNNSINNQQISETEFHSGFTEYLTRNFSASALSPLAIRYVPSMHFDMERWAVAGRRVNFAMETQPKLQSLTPISYQHQFGNSFIFFMEYFCRLITDSIDVILHNNNSLTKYKKRLGSLSPFAKNYREQYEHYMIKISHIKDVMSRHEKMLGKRLLNLANWSEIAEVNQDTKAFFAAYTLGYFGENISLEGLNWWFAYDNDYIAK